LGFLKEGSALTRIGALLLGVEDSTKGEGILFLPGAIKPGGGEKAILLINGGNGHPRTPRLQLDNVANPEFSHGLIAFFLMDICLFQARYLLVRETGKPTVPQVVLASQCDYLVCCDAKIKFLDSRNSRCFDAGLSA